MARDASSIVRKLVGHDAATRQRVALHRLCAVVAEELLAAREAAGLTQQQLAALAGTTQSAIARIEDADYEGHSLRTINRIATVLGRTVSIRFEGGESAAESPEASSGRGVRRSGQPKPRAGRERRSKAWRE